jgi:hypothetical protein
MNLRYQNIHYKFFAKKNIQYMYSTFDLMVDQWCQICHSLLGIVDNM